MEDKNKIEKAVSEYFKVQKKALYDTSDNEYPLNGARSILMYLLYFHKVFKMYEIRDRFGYSASRTVELRISYVASKVKKGNNKIADDVKSIEETILKK